MMSSILNISETCSSFRHPRNHRIKPCPHSPESILVAGTAFLFFLFHRHLTYFILFSATILSQKIHQVCQHFLLTIVAKLMLYIGVMIVYVFINRKDAIAFMLGFFILYLCYTFSK